MCQKRPNNNISKIFILATIQFFYILLAEIFHFHFLAEAFLINQLELVNEEQD